MTVTMVGEVAKLLHGPLHGGSAGPSCLSQLTDAGGGGQLQL